MIEKIPFGNTGHNSTRTLFGAAALGGMRQEKADQVLETLLAHGVNHIDTAASYGDAELRIQPWMKTRRAEFFLATKTAERTYDGAKAGLHRSLERLGVEQLDLIQMHNLVDEDGWQTALAAGGALEALTQARDEGLVRFLGVTGHGTQVAAMHLRSLERHPFDSVLLPYNFTMMSQPAYAAEFEALVSVCEERGVAVQTIKSIARRRWTENPERRFSWYEPLTEPEAIACAVRWALGRPGIFLNTSSDARFLETALAAAAELGERPTDDAMRAETTRAGVEPLFVPGHDGI